MLAMTTPTPAKRTPTRTCVGCREALPQTELVRLALAEGEPFVVPDLRGTLPGRGAWVMPRRECVVAAVKKGGLARAAKRAVPITPEELLNRLTQAYTRRIEGLLASARRTRAVALGTDAVREAMAKHQVSLLMIANDAAGRRDELLRAAERLERRAVLYGTKAELGAAFDRKELGVLALLDRGIANEICSAAERQRALLEVA